MHSEPAAGVRPQSVGSLRFLTVLLVRAAPLYPGEPSDYRPMGDRLAVIRSPLVQASPNLGGWPLPLERFEASTVGSLALRLGPSRSRGFDGPITQRHRPRRYMCHRQFTWWSPCRSQDRVRLP